MFKNCAPKTKFKSFLKINLKKGLIPQRITYTLNEFPFTHSHHS